MTLDQIVSDTYCAMWIYDQQELNKWIDSEYWDLRKILPFKKGRDGCELMIREKSAYGLHHVKTTFYKTTIVPLTECGFDPDCRLYHLANNYLNDPKMATIEFTDIIKV
jgi:hypothetical protein